MLKIENLTFAYPSCEPVLKNFSMVLTGGELLCVMAPSGSGKSTLLNLIAGLLRPNDGEIHSDFKKISYVFQEPRLFPWLTVEENVRAVLEKSASAETVAEALRLVGLDGCERLYPSELSGGMKIRLSLARALAHNGDLFLLDEPFASLDEELRGDLIPRLREILKERGISAILVSHHPADAERFADRILSLEHFVENLIST